MDMVQAKTRADAGRQTNQLLRGIIIAFRARMDEELKPQGCTLAQVRVLHEIQQNPGVSGAGIARACGVTPQSAQAMLVRAVERGWATRTKSAGNERLVTAKLTRAGERLLAASQEVKSRMEAEAWAGVPLAELRQMNAILARGLANVER